MKKCRIISKSSVPSRLRPITPDPEQLVPEEAVQRLTLNAQLPTLSAVVAKADSSLVEQTKRKTKHLALRKPDEELGL